MINKIDTPKFAFENSLRKITFNSNKFLFSYDNRSVITPNGDIYLVGGRLHRSSHETPDNTLFVYKSPLNSENA